MKQIHTKSKKANRRSSYSKDGSFRLLSNGRKAKRAAMQPKERPCFGLQILRTQAIAIASHNRTFTKTIYHAAD